MSRYPYNSLLAPIVAALSVFPARTIRLVPPIFESLPIRRNSHYDLESSTASQAYIGDKASAKARRAVAATRGQVLVYDGRVLPAFYSSCTGGVGQDAVAAWPGKVDDLAPLRGRNHGGWGSTSSKFRWGPVHMTTADLIAALSRAFGAEPAPQ